MITGKDEVVVVRLNHGKDNGPSFLLLCDFAKTFLFLSVGWGYNLDFVMCWSISSSIGYTCKFCALMFRSSEVEFQVWDILDWCWH